MTTGLISPGCVIHWKDYVFDNGQTANKYLVIVGAKQGCNYLAVVATSQPRKRKFEPGCHATEGYYHIGGGGKDHFPKDTWLLVAEAVELTPAELVKRAMVEKTISIVGQLRGEIANALRNCLKRCPDVSPAQIALLM